MSFSEKDRKLQSGTGKEFPIPAATEPLASAIAAALKAEFGDTPAALKTVARMTRSNERAVRNWMEAKKAPSAENLVILMRHSDLILRTVLALADRRDLVMAVGLVALRRHLMDTVAAIDGLTPDAAGSG